MRISVSRSELFGQLPLDVRRELVGNPAIPEVFHFEVAEYSVNRQHEHKKLAGEYPDVERLLSPMEWFIFSMLVQHPDGVEYSTLGEKTRSRGRNPNTVVVHAKNLRRKLRENRLPFDLLTMRGSVLGSGAYKLVRKDQ
jgi:DNA-binding response OmpR family regulator